LLTAFVRNREGRRKLGRPSLVERMMMMIIIIIMMIIIIIIMCPKGRLIPMISRSKV